MFCSLLLFLKNTVCYFLDFVLKPTAREHNRNLYNIRSQYLNTNHKKNVNHHLFLPVEIPFTNLSNHFPVFKTKTSALGKPHFNDQLIRYKSVITCKYIQSLIINLCMAADAERMERVATTCVVIQKIRYLFNDPKKNEKLICSQICQILAYLPYSVFHFKEVKKLEFKDKFLSLDFHQPSGDSAAHIKQKHQVGSEATARCSALKLLHNRPGDQTCQEMCSPLNSSLVSIKIQKYPDFFPSPASIFLHSLIHIQYNIFTLCVLIVLIFLSSNPKIPLVT